MPSFFQFKNLLHSATTSFLSKTLNTFDNDIINTADQTKDDIAGVRATTNVNMQVSHEPTDTDDDNSSNIGTTFALKYCYLASTNNTSHKSNTDSTHTYLVKDKEEYDKAKLFRSQYPINKFAEGEHGLVATFPHVFMFIQEKYQQFDN